MPTQQESKQESLQTRIDKLPNHLGEHIGERAKDAAIATYDKAIEKNQTPTQASILAHKEFDGVLKPWDLLV